MILETLSSDHPPYFVTLTYAPEHLPDSDVFEGGQVHKEEMQKFLKRLRKHLRFRYFAVGEYGDKSKRAHYHLIIWPSTPPQYVGLEYYDVELFIRSCWKFGHVMIGPAEIGSFSYVAHYVTKKMTTVSSFEDGRNPEFTLMSRKPGLGHKYIPRLCEIMLRTGYHLRFTENLFQEYYRLRENPYIDYEQPLDRLWNGTLWLKVDKSQIVLTFPKNVDKIPDGVRVLRVDAVMKRKIAEQLYSWAVDYFKRVDSETWIFPRTYKKFRDRVIHEKEIALKEYLSSEDFKRQKTLSEKFQARYKERRKL